MTHILRHLRTSEPGDQPAGPTPFTRPTWTQNPPSPTTPASTPTSGRSMVTGATDRATTPTGTTQPDTHVQWANIAVKTSIFAKLRAMDEIKTIRRNATRKIAAIRGQRTKCLCFSLESGFGGVEVDPQLAWTRFDKYTFAKLVRRVSPRGDVYVIEVHGNLWYEFPEV